MATPKKKAAPAPMIADNSDIAPYEREPYEMRRRAVAELIRPDDIVLDLGAGSGRLGLLIPCQYIPVDLKQRTTDTVRWDVNSSLPPLEVRPTVVTAIGLLEYIHDLPALFERIAACGAERVIATYNDRRSEWCNAAWANHLTLDELQDVAAKAGLRPVQAIPFGVQTILEWQVL